jgi:hypothetical protein
MIDIEEYNITIPKVKEAQNKIHNVSVWHRVVNPLAMVRYGPNPKPSPDCK